MEYKTITTQNGETMDIPEWDVWERQEFLHARYKQFEAAYRDWIERGKPGNEHIVEPSVEIICDFCDAEITTHYVNLAQFGKKALCDRCFQKY